MLEIGGNDFNYAFLPQQTRPSDGGYGLGNVTRIVETLQQAGALVPPVVQSISNAAEVRTHLNSIIHDKTKLDASVKFQIFEHFSPILVYVPNSQSPHLIRSCWRWARSGW